MLCCFKLICNASIFLSLVSLIQPSSCVAQNWLTEEKNQPDDFLVLVNNLNQTGANLEVKPPSENFLELITPTFNFNMELMAETDQIQMSNFGGRVTIPTYPVFGPPPPMIGLGYSYMNLDAPDSLDLPSDLHEMTLGLSWIRSINEDWKLRLSLGAAFNTDGQNRSSDAWQFRGGIFGMYQTTPEWNWLFGVIALGRNDLPVVPAVGLIYQPNSDFRLDLTMPKPRFSFKLSENGGRQQWGYFGAGISGGTWGYERENGLHDQLTYGDWRLVAGWESVPRKQKGSPFTRGRKISAEIGYAFSRDLEFENVTPDISLGDTWLFQMMMTL